MSDAVPPGRTTLEMLERLDRYGLGVTANMLGQDVKAGYLPKLTPDPRGPGRGIGRSWEPWTLERAVYLYRLRRRGASGSVLRLLLFFRDGWGWESVKPVCLEGFRKLVEAEQIPLNRTTRVLNPRSVNSVLEDAAEKADFKHEEVPRFSWGMGLFGKPLPGASLREGENAQRDSSRDNPSEPDGSGRPYSRPTPRREQGAVFLRLSAEGEVRHYTRVGPRASRIAECIRPPRRGRCEEGNERGAVA